MEKKKNNQKLASSCIQESETNAPPNKQEQAQPDASLGTSTKTGSPSHDNAPSSVQPQPPILQWSFATQNAAEQLPAISFPTQVSSPGILNQWQQLPHTQQNSTNQVQQCQAFVQSTSPFWQAHRPGGPLFGANIPAIYQTFTPFGTTDAGWQAHPVMAGGTSSRSQPLVPNTCCHVGYTFPGFPGPWDPSSWLGQIHQLQNPYAYSFPATLGYSSASPRMTDCLASVEHSFQRGVIRPPAKLSQKHQQLWEAQSGENVQLWSVINNLQSEVNDYKDCLMKLVEEVSSLKQKAEEPTAEVTGTVAAGTGPPSKRGRPKRSVASVDALRDSHSHPRVRGRKPAVISKAQLETEIKSPIFERVILNKMGNKEKTCHSTITMTQQENNENISHAVTHSSRNMRIDQSNLMMMSTYQAQGQQEYQGIQICGNAFNSNSGVKGNVEKDKELKIACSELPQPDKVLNNMDASTNYIGSTENGSLEWPSGVPSQDSARNVFDIGRQSFFLGGGFIKQGEKITPGWSFANEEDASEELEDVVVGSAKDENEEEMVNDTSSGAEELGGTKDEGACAMNNVITATSSKNLSPLNNWE